MTALLGVYDRKITFFRHFTFDGGILKRFLNILEKTENELNPELKHTCVTEMSVVVKREYA